MTDYIRLPRSALEHIPSALHRGIFLSLLERADENGQLSISVRGLADEIDVGYQVLRTALAKLEANAIINAKPTQRLTQITICGFANYSTPPRKLQRKLNATANAIGNAKFTPPTDAEVAAFVADKGFHFDPGAFVPFYQSKGWMVGKNPMKDWRASCRTWEIEWKKKHGERFYYEIEQPLARPAFASQNGRYSELERAAEAVLRNAPYYDSPQND